jgi:hypothetical protein
MLIPEDDSRPGDRCLAQWSRPWRWSASWARSIRSARKSRMGLGSAASCIASSSSSLTWSAMAAPWIREGTGPPFIRLPRNRLRWRWGVMYSLDWKNAPNGPDVTPLRQVQTLNELLALVGPLRGAAGRAHAPRDGPPAAALAHGPSPVLPLQAPDAPTTPKPSRRCRAAASGCRPTRRRRPERRLEPVVWHGPCRTSSGRLPGRGVRRPPARAGWRPRTLGVAVAVSSGAQMRVHPAALPLDLIVISGRVVQWPCEQRCCVMDGVVNGR